MRPPRLTAAEIERAMGRLPGWVHRDGVIVRTFSFSSFPAAVAFVGRLVAPAEAADHHPDLEIRYDRVTVFCTTHSAGGLTALDFALAAETERAAKEHAGD